MSAQIPLLEVANLVKTFGRGDDALRAVDDVSFTLHQGESLGCVGESGCGKTTLGRATLRLLEPDSGSVRFRDPRSGAVHDVLALDATRLRRLRRHMQIVFQDPYSSLNPRMRVRELVGEAIAVHGLARGAQLRERVDALLERVGLDPSAASRFPHEFSGGQRQRIGIARALALEPDFIVLDEPVSALDVSVQAQIVNLLEQLEVDLGLAYLFISHDLAVVRHLCQRVMVLYLGQIVETGPSADVFATPRHPYTRALLAAIPAAHPTRRAPHVALEGDPPSPRHPPSGCRFRTRCPLAAAICAESAPPWRTSKDGHVYRCHFET
jgi:peptide/nickel transport system ATP-binding protein